jgi:hypothetical protein
MRIILICEYIPNIFLEERGSRIAHCLQRRDGGCEIIHGVLTVAGNESLQAPLDSFFDKYLIDVFNLFPESIFRFLFFFFFF